MENTYLEFFLYFAHVQKQAQWKVTEMIKGV